MPNRESYRPRGLFVIAGIGVLVAAAVVVVTWTFSVSAQANSWAISKSANATNVYVGGEVIYTIAFTNTGTTVQTGTMTDQLPFGVTYVGGSVTGGGSYDSGTGSINWSGPLAVDASHSVSFRALVVEPGTVGPLPIVNDAQIDGTWSNTVTVYSTPAGSWAISKSANATNVYVGGEVIYTIAFTNTGTTVQTGIMTDQLPFGVTYAGGVTGGGSYDPGTGSINWTGPLAVGASHSVSFRALVVEPGTAGPLPIVNDAQINGTSSNTVTVYSTPAGSWAISKSANATNVYVGDEVLYTIAFTNTGTAGQTGTMIDQIPYGVTYVGGSVTGGGSYDPGTGSINWTGPVAVGASHSVSFRALVVEPGTAGPLPIVNDAQINGTWSNTVTIYSRQPSGAIYLPIVMRNYDPSLVWPWSEP